MVAGSTRDRHAARREKTPADGKGGAGSRRPQGAAGVELTTGSGIDESEKESPRPHKQRDLAQTKNGPAGWIRRAR